MEMDLENMDESQPISRLLSHDAASNSNELEYGLKTTPKGVNEYAVLYYGTWRPVESTNQPSVVYRSNKNLNLQMKLLFIVLWGVFFVFLVIALLVLLL